MARRSSKWHGRQWSGRWGEREKQPSLEAPEGLRDFKAEPVYLYHGPIVTSQAGPYGCRVGRIKDRRWEDDSSTGGREVLIDQHGTRWVRRSGADGASGTTGGRTGFAREGYMYAY